MCFSAVLSFHIGTDLLDIQIVRYSNTQELLFEKQILYTSISLMESLISFSYNRAT